MKTTLPKDRGTERDWYLVDAADKPVGRLAVQIANILRGRQNPTYTPHMDTGDFVVVINAARVKLTGRKEEQKQYQRYSGFRGGLKKESAAMVRARNPERIVEQAVKGMMPKNHLNRKLYSRLKVYAGPEHPHEAQMPKAINVAE